MTVFTRVEYQKWLERRTRARCGKGELVKTGYVHPGHDLTFTYPMVGDARTCWVNCECGWSTQLTAYPNSSAVLELKKRFNDHLPSNAD